MAIFLTQRSLSRLPPVLLQLAPMKKSIMSIISPISQHPNIQQNLHQATYQGSINLFSVAYFFFFFQERSTNHSQFFSAGIIEMIYTWKEKDTNILEPNLLGVHILESHWANTSSNSIWLHISFLFLHITSASSCDFQVSSKVKRNKGRSACYLCTPKSFML